MSFWRRVAQLHGAFLVEEIQRLIPGPAVGAAMFFHHTHHEGGVTVSDIQVLDTDQPFAATAVFVDADGNPTTPTNVTWASDNEAVATVAASADGLTGTVTPTGAGGLGAAVITATDQNPDGTTATAQGTVTVVASDATTGEITFQPPAAAAAAAPADTGATTADAASAPPADTGVAGVADATQTAPAEPAAPADTGANTGPDATAAPPQGG